MNDESRHQGERCLICRYIGFGILAVIVGIPGVMFLIVLTWGAIFIPLAGLFMLSPLLLANYLLWGLPRASDAKPQASESRSLTNPS